MNTYGKFLIMLTIVAIAAPLMAQEEGSPPMVAENFFVTTDPGLALEFESAYRDHMEWHAQENDTWYWHTWQIVSGNNVGQYIVRSGNHAWADFDEHAEFASDDWAHFQSNVAKYVKEMSSTMVVSDPDISNWPDDYGIPTMVDVTVFQVNNEYDRAFYHTIKKLHAAIIDKEMPFTYAWSFVASGGEGPGPTWVMVFPFKNWAEYGASWEPRFWQMVEEVYGDFETDLIRKMMNKAIVHGENYMVAYRPDLSYNPPE
jgi:hypothetical protein